MIILILSLVENPQAAKLTSYKQMKIIGLSVDIFDTDAVQKLTR